MITKNKNGNWVYFIMTSDFEPRLDDIKNAQTKEGYLIMGYGIEDVKITQEAPGKFLSTWKCSSSCE